MSEVAIRYAAKGAERAQQADRGVRRSIQRTARVARKEEGTIKRWMQRHQGALLAIGAASAAAMAAIIRASPELAAQLATVRLGFSLLAMTIGQDVAPVTQGLGEAVIGLADKYHELDPAIRKPISKLIFFGAIIAGAIGALGALVTAISSWVLPGLAALAGFLPSLSSIMYGLGVVVGIVEFALAALAGALGITVGAAAALVVAIVAVIAIIVAYIFNIGGARDAINGWLADTWNFVNGALGALLKFGKLAISILIKFVKGSLAWFGRLFKKGVKRFNDLKKRVIARARQLKNKVISRFTELATDGIAAVVRLKDRSVEAAGDLKREAIRRASELYDGVKKWLTSLASDAYGWGRDLIDEFADGVNSRLSALRDRVEDAVDSIKSKLSFDRISNDRMARRWGSDLIEEFSRGVEQRAGLLQNTIPSPIAGGAGPSPAPSRNAAGGANVTVVIEQGAIQMRGGSTAGINADRTGSAVAREIGDMFNGRR